MISDSIRQTTAVEETERSRLAEMLHDSVGQVLSLCRIQLDLLAKELTDPHQTQSLAKIRDLLDNTIEQTRVLVSGTHPAVLHELGLAAAVRQLAEQFQEIYGIAVEVEADSHPDPADPTEREVLYTAVRELLTNVRKYAGTPRAKVTLRQEPRQIQVKVEDHGKGFQPDQARVYPSKQGGFGLMNMRQRCEQIGADLVLDSSPGRGTVASITMPLRPVNGFEA